MLLELNMLTVSLTKLYSQPTEIWRRWDKSSNNCCFSGKITLAFFKPVFRLWHTIVWTLKEMNQLHTAATKVNRASEWRRSRSEKIFWSNRENTENMLLLSLWAVFLVQHQFRFVWIDDFKPRKNLFRCVGRVTKYVDKLFWQWMN